MPEELWDHDGFLEDVRRTCELQNIPMTTVHSEFSPGQYEINLHHVDDPVTPVIMAYCLSELSRWHESMVWQPALWPSLLQKSLAAGYIFFSLYDKEGVNIFADESAKQQPGISSVCAMLLADWLILWRMRWQFLHLLPTPTAVLYPVTMRPKPKLGL